MCSTNSDCTKGYCCNSAQTACALAGDCYNGDDKLDFLWRCSKNSECASRCCSDWLSICVGSLNTDNDCKKDSLPGWAIAIIVLVVLGVVGGIIGCICCCVCASRRAKRRH